MSQRTIKYNVNIEIRTSPRSFLSNVRSHSNEKRFPRNTRSINNYKVYRTYLYYARNRNVVLVLEYSVQLNAFARGWIAVREICICGLSVRTGGQNNIGDVSGIILSLYLFDLFARWEQRPR